MLGSLSLIARRPLLCSATTLAAVAALSGGVALASGGPSGASAAAQPRTRLSVVADGPPIPSIPPVADRLDDSRAPAQSRRAAVAAAAHQEELAAAAARATVAAERRAAAARSSRDRQRARLVATNPRAVARALVAQRGWSSSEFGCLDNLWTKESGWQHTARNRASGAYGIPQALPGAKMATAGPDWRTNPATQMTWGLNYIADRYGTPCSAWAHSISTNWY